MSCPKIRSRLPEIAAATDCNCDFEPDAGMYPNPLIHLQALRARGTLHTEAERLSPLQIERLSSDLFRVRRDLYRLQRLDHDIVLRYTGCFAKNVIQGTPCFLRPL